MSTFIMSGCSIMLECLGCGVVGGIYENSKKKDTRQCKIWSQGFTLKFKLIVSTIGTDNRRSSSLVEMRPGALSVTRLSGESPVNNKLC